MSAEGWMARQGAPPAELTALLTGIVTSLRIHAAFDAACGRQGLRRFLVRLERQGSRFRLRAIDSERLPSGGPPDPRAMEQARPRLEQLIGQLAERLTGQPAERPAGQPAASGSFDRVAIGVVRDAGEWPHLSFRFDEDGDRYRLPDVRAPKGEGLAVEDADYLKALDGWTPRIHAVRARWISPSVDERWEIAAGRLRLIGALERSLRAEPLATWAPHTGDFVWLTPRPVGDEGPFLRPELVLEMGPALELVSFAATRAGATGVFQGGLAQPPGVQVFAAVWE